MAIKTEPFVVNMGPQHPSTHGVFRMRATLDGEVVLDIEPIFGYLHRGVEKLCEGRNYHQVIPITDRLDYAASMSNNLAYVMAVEKLCQITVPERAQYLRVITAEMQRLASHCLAVGSFANDTGTFFTAFMYLWREREKIVDLFDLLCGQRLTYNYMRIGGVSHDITEQFTEGLTKFIPVMRRALDEIDDLLETNEILLVRAKGVGILSRKQAINSSASGPVLRGSGVKWDLRKDDPYLVYDRFKFDVPTGKAGDCYDRYRVRVEEMRQSLSIIEQAMAQMPKGAIINREVPPVLYPPVGETYGHIESPKGEYGYYLVSDGGVAPYRLHIRPTTLLNLTALREMIRGWKIADAIVIFGSIDICLGEVDR